MTILSCDLAQEGSTLSGTGTLQGETKRSFRSRYIVKTDNPLTNPLDIEFYFAARPVLPYYGRLWTWSNGVAANSYCTSFNVNHQPRSAGIFEVEAGFEPVDGEEKKKEDDKGKESTNPEEWRETINVSYTQYTEAARRSIFRGFDPPNINNPSFTDGDELPLQNTAEVVNDPPPEKFVNIKVIRFGKWVPYMPDDVFLGTVNSVAYTIDKFGPYSFKQEVKKWCGLIKGIGGHVEIINGSPWWHRETELWIHPRSWLDERLDMGTERRAKPGDPRRNGFGTISQTDINVGDPLSEMIVGPSGEPILTPVKLNGNGQPKGIGDPDVFLKWMHYPEYNHGLYPW